MKKSRARKIIIDDQQWLWVVQKARDFHVKEIRIYSPSKKLYRIEGKYLQLINPDILQEEYERVPVTPSQIKNYILTHIKIDAEIL